jgi:flagellar export protein FliJ
MDDDRLLRLVLLAKQREEQTRKAFSVARERVRAVEVKIEQLEDFGREYVARQASLASDGIAVHQMRDYGRFVTRVEQSVEEQRKTLLAVEAEADRRQREWVVAGTERKSLARVAERRAADTARALERREQAVIDEAGQLAAILRRQTLTG